MLLHPHLTDMYKIDKASVDEFFEYEVNDFNTLEKKCANIEKNSLDLQKLTSRQHSKLSASRDPTVGSAFRHNSEKTNVEVIISDVISKARILASAFNNTRSSMRTGIIGKQGEDENAEEMKSSKNNKNSESNFSREDIPKYALFQLDFVQPNFSPKGNYLIFSSKYRQYCPMVDNKRSESCTGSYKGAFFQIAPNAGFTNFLVDVGMGRTIIPTQTVSL